jgi:hypothetical protein
MKSSASAHIPDMRVVADAEIGPDFSVSDNVEIVRCR